MLNLMYIRTVADPEMTEAIFLWDVAIRTVAQAPVIPHTADLTIFISQ